MEVSQNALAFMLFCALLCGVALGCVYDVLRMTRFWTDGIEPTALSPRVKVLRDRLTMPSALRLPKRKSKRPSNKKKAILSAVVLFIQDLLFCLLFAVVASLLFYQTNDGQLRMSAIVVMSLGLALYLTTIGRLAKRFWIILTILLSSILGWIVALLIYPVRLLLRCLKKPFSWLIGRVRGICDRVKQRFELKKQARIQRKQAKEKDNSEKFANKRKLVGQSPDGKRVFVLGGKRKLN